MIYIRAAAIAPRMLYANPSEARIVMLSSVPARPAKNDNHAAARRGGRDAEAHADRPVDELRRMRILAEVADVVTQRLSLDHQLPRLIELITQSLDAERATLFLYDAEKNELFSRVLSGAGVTEIRIPATTGIAGAVFGSGTDEIIPEAYLDPRFNPEVDRQTGYRTRNMICVPLRNHDGEVIGVTQVLNKRSGDFHEADLEFAKAISRQAASALEQSFLVEQLEKTEHALRRTNRALRTLSHGNQALVHSRSESELLGDMCRLAVEEGGYRLAWFGVPQQNVGKTVKPVAWAGEGSADLVAQVQIGWGDDPYGGGTCGRAVRTGEPQICENIGTDRAMAPWHAQTAQYGLASAVALPLKQDGKVFAVLMIYASETHAFDPEEIDLLRELATDCAYGVRSIRDRAARDAALRSWHESLEATIGAIASTLELRDPYTAGHQQRVAQLAVAIAHELKLGEDKIHGLYLAGAIHDVGKIKIPAEILNHPGQLSELEFALIKTHAECGYEILKKVDFPWPIAEMIRQHHERIDGSGYPRGLRGDALLIEANILAVADVVEAMVSHRPYRPGIGIDAALAEIRKNRGRLYEAGAVDACLALFREARFTFDRAVPRPPAALSPPAPLAIPAA